MHFPATLRNYSGIMAARHNHSCIFDQKTDCGRQTHVATFGGGGRTSLLLPPGAENPSYATVKYYFSALKPTLFTLVVMQCFLPAFTCIGVLALYLMIKFSFLILFSFYQLSISQFVCTVLL